MTQIKAVNLGGWLVVEKWMTPALFTGVDAIDEYTLSQTAKGRARIVKHRREFITEADITRLRQWGVEMVRIPVGYWLFIDAAPFVGGTEPLDRCMRWCERHGMRVLLDLHAVPGSQNGNDHSGRVGPIQFWDDVAYQDQAIEVLKIMAKRYGDSPALWGIQLLNEPHVGLHPRRLRQWYRRAYDAIDELLPSGVKIVFSDGFRPRLMNGALGRRPRAVMDVHHYQFATKYVRLSRLSLRLYKWRLWWRGQLVKRLSWVQPVIIGEWSGVLGHELLAAERIGDAVYQENLLLWHIQAQQRAFTSAIAMCYWSYKAESGVDPIWQAAAMVERGVLRYNIKNEQY
ncbi:MAG: cellulase family glycosylhydrolase [Candidatus Saccharibacteria bacterium]|nr:cellulase family glycosylhydrolase [Candidatus Saccharibacteria bacterium]